jgi:zinc/manganese transport system substrate-binding protein
MLAWCSQAAPAAAPPVRVVVSFSILEDIVRRIGGGEVAVTSLIGPDSDAHVFGPNPEQVRLLARAQLLVVNGLGFEGWLAQLSRSAQFGGVVMTATDGISPITTTEPSETSPVPDPHAWQDPRILGSWSSSRETSAWFRDRRSIPTLCRGQMGRPRPTSG